MAESHMTVQRSVSITGTDEAAGKHSEIVETYHPSGEFRKTNVSLRFLSAKVVVCLQL